MTTIIDTHDLAQKVANIAESSGSVMMPDEEIVDFITELSVHTDLKTDQELVNFMLASTVKHLIVLGVLMQRRAICSNL